MRKKNAAGVRLAVKVAKKTLSVAAKILIELVEQQRDLNFLYFHRTHDWRPVRELRYEHVYFEALKEERLRRQAIKRLRENNYIKLQKEGNRVIATLTEDGRVKALQALIKSSTAYLGDGRLCLVSFDFPEAARAGRYSFRWFLKLSGFRFVQGSLWSIKKDVSGELRQLVALLQIGRWVKVFIAEE
jgi:hypothetical protein